jgi:indole-3-glycerol phosphate synthase
MNKLQEIISRKKKEVEERSGLYPVKLLEKSIYFKSKTVSLRKYILREDKNGIIAEIKRKSPSKGILNNHISIEKVSIGYMQAGASALSVLTDTDFFGGTNEDLIMARRFNFCPILRKDFIIDEYQVLEAKSIGADAILLIAAVLPKEKIVSLAKLAHSLDMEVLLEVHSMQELNDSLTPDVDLIGVNNRDLSTFQVSLQTSMVLANHIPDEFVKVSESGIKTPDDIIKLSEYGFRGFLIGEGFMKTARPEVACRMFIEELRGTVYQVQ